jgi:hypothetical protein
MLLVARTVQEEGDVERIRILSAEYPFVRTHRMGGRGTPSPSFTACATLSD